MSEPVHYSSGYTDLQQNICALQKAWLNAAFTTIEPWFDCLGAMGARFRAAFHKAACNEAVDTDMTSRAAISTHHSSFGFINQIDYGPTMLCENNLKTLFGSRMHEGTHAIQYDTIPVLHATPYNAHVPIALCPRDAMAIQILSERQAFAVQSLAVELLDVFLGSQNLPADDKMAEHLDHSIEHVKPEWRWDNDTQFVEYYRHYIMKQYTQCRSGPVTYVRMEDQDLYDFATFLGMSIMGRDLYKIRALFDLDLTFDQKLRLEALNANLGITDENTLPTLSAALAARGLDRGRFLILSRARKSSIPGP